MPLTRPLHVHDQVTTPMHFIHRALRHCPFFKTDKREALDSLPDAGVTVATGVDMHEDRHAQTRRTTRASHSPLCPRRGWSREGLGDHRASRPYVTSTRQDHGCASMVEHICLSHLSPVQPQVRGHPHPRGLPEVSFLTINLRDQSHSAAIS